MIRYRALAGRAAASAACRAARRGALAALVMLAAASCASDGDELAATPSSTMADPPPRIEAAHFHATDGERLPLRKWLPAGEPRAVILALHGFNDYSNAFDAPAKLWAARGIATYAYDQRGFGGAPGRLYWPGSVALATDAIAAAGALRAAYPGKKLYLLGESMGGAVATLAVTGAAGLPRAPVDGVILSAPAVWTRASMEFLPRIALWAGVRMFPNWVVTGESLNILASDNIPMLRALGNDPMVIKGTRVDTLYGLVNLMDATIKAAPGIKLPLLLQYGAHDAVIPGVSVGEFVTRLPAEPPSRQRLAYYKAGYHMLLRDLEGPLVAADVASWAFDPGAPLPSGADARSRERPWPPPSESGG
jgi:alpha-beta hydrolase superfamily lysophospholipase